MRIKAQDIMSAPPHTVTEGTNLAAAAHLMLKRGIGCVLVVDRTRRITGILTESDYTAKKKGIPFSTLTCPQVFGEWVGPESIKRIYDAACARSVAEIMSWPVYTVEPTTPLDQVLTIMLDRKIKHVAVTSDGMPVGVITPHDVLKLMHSEPGP